VADLHHRDAHAPANLEMPVDRQFEEPYLTHGVEFLRNRIKMGR